ncbi:hypothetical protein CAUPRSCDRAFT_12949 [Caulochytrium protostelioides]|uniref:Uncharacterized protein n=1 Tax=Caulochytrium protostelioides TaxID=1555241 RepID=A0A4V1IT02_9FUNG|nr:hypothetical protein CAUPRSCDRAFT_12949 [Caulochytrium protostelioides]
MVETNAVPATAMLYQHHWPDYQARVDPFLTGMKQRLLAFFVRRFHCLYPKEGTPPSLRAHAITELHLLLPQIEQIMIRRAAFVRPGVLGIKFKGVQDFTEASGIFSFVGLHRRLVARNIVSDTAAEPSFRADFSHRDRHVPDINMCRGMRQSGPSPIATALTNGLLVLYDVARAKILDIYDESCVSELSQLIADRGLSSCSTTASYSSAANEQNSGEDLNRELRALESQLPHTKM